MGNPNWCDAIRHKAERFASADSMERVCMLRRALFRYGIVAPVDALLLLTALLDLWIGLFGIGLGTGQLRKCTCIEQDFEFTRIECAAALGSVLDI